MASAPAQPGSARGKEDAALASAGPTADTADSAAAESPRHSLSRFVSDDLNVRCAGRIVQHAESGRIDGIRLELDDGPDAETISVLYPQLVSVHTKPESQTLVSINTGEKLLTLETPLLPPDDDDEDSPDQSSEALEEDEVAVEDEADEDVSDLEDMTPSRSAKPARSSATKAKGGQPDRKKKKRRTVITLHEGFLPASEIPQLEESPLYSTTFRIIIDRPSYPPPHFDPASLAPPTPAVRPHGANSGTADSTSAYGGVLNSPTLQRALLSPLLSPQRRAVSQSSDASVPPLSLGLSRASRRSFTAPERPRVDNKPTHVTLLTLIPSLAFGRAGPAAASGTPQVSAVNFGGAPSSTSADQGSHVPGATLNGTLTTSLSAAAKRTAEEILSLRRSHDTFQRRARAELDVLEARIEKARSEAGTAVAVGGTDAVVRGFRTKDGQPQKVEDREGRKGSVSRSRDRGESPQQNRGREERSSRDPVPGSAAAAAATPSRPGLTSSSSTQSASVSTRETRDEATSALIRAQDEREEDERGRSRSRSRRSGSQTSSARTGGEGTPASADPSPAIGSQRSRSRTKAVAEATLRAVEGAKERQAAGGSSASTSSHLASPAAVEEQRDQELAPPPSVDADGPSEEDQARTLMRRGGSETSSPKPSEQTSPSAKGGAALSSSARNEGEGPKAPALLSPPSGAQPLPSPSRSQPPQGSTTPSFAPTSHALMAIPESDELSIPLERTASGGLELDVPKEAPPPVKAEPETPEEESEPPFEMDEDVEIEERKAAAPSRHAPALDSPTLERENAADIPLPASATQHSQSQSQQPAPMSSSFRPGSFRRASALSASYNAMLASTKSTPAQPSLEAVSPSAGPARSPFMTPERIIEDRLPPFSPPDAKSVSTASVREDVQTALLSATQERTNENRGQKHDPSRGGSIPGTRGYVGPDLKDVRKGEQKIRDVLAMDVPSHRPRGASTAPRKDSGAERGAAGGFDDESSAEEEDSDAASSEEGDEVEELVSPSNAGRASVGMAASGSTGGGAQDGSTAEGAGSSSMQVGSLPIALGRPSTTHAALSSWRPDPEREWAQHRRERKSSVPASKEGMWVPPLQRASSGTKRESAGNASPQSAAQQQQQQQQADSHERRLSERMLAGGQAALLSPQSPVQGSAPVEIGSPTNPRPGEVGSGEGRSSLARSLRAQQGVGTYVQKTPAGGAAHRASGGEGTGSAPNVNGRDPFENQRMGEDRTSDENEARGGGGGDSSGRGSGRSSADGDRDGDERNEEGGDGEEDDFVPPHLVKFQREREDEEWLSRSVPKS